MERSAKALEEFNMGLNCAQCVLLAFTDELKLEKDVALKISSGFGGGMCQGELCGAVTGAVMALNIKYGNTEADDSCAKEKVYEKVREFSNQFKEINGSIICRELLGYDLNDPSMRAVAREKGLFKEVCPKVVKDAVDILESIL